MYKNLNMSLNELDLAQQEDLKTLYKELGLDYSEIKRWRTYVDLDFERLNILKQHREAKNGNH